MFEEQQHLDKAVEFLWKAKDLLRSSTNPEDTTLAIGYVQRAYEMLYEVKEELCTSLDNRTES